MAWETKDDKERRAIEPIIEGWIGINKYENKEAFRYWQEWRKLVLGSTLDCKGLTVPSPFPPETKGEVEEYLTALREIKRVLGYSTHRIPKTAPAWIIPL